MHDIHSLKNSIVSYHCINEQKRRIIAVLLNRIKETEGVNKKGEDNVVGITVNHKT